MTEQTQILAQMHELIISILKTGQASVEQGEEIDKLEALLHEQNCYVEIKNGEHTYQGEEIASNFFSGNNEKAIDMMVEHEISPEDFFGFAQYHYDDEEDEHLVEMFTSSFISDVSKNYQLKCTSKS